MEKQMLLKIIGFLMTFPAGLMICDWFEIHGIKGWKGFLLNIFVIVLLFEGIKLME